LLAAAWAEKGIGSPVVPDAGTEGEQERAHPGPFTVTETVARLESVEPSQAATVKLSEPV
jgi:hypothetical protein